MKFIWTRLPAGYDIRHNYKRLGEGLEFSFVSYLPAAMQSCHDIHSGKMMRRRKNKESFGDDKTCPSEDEPP